MKTYSFSNWYDLKGTHDRNCAKYLKSLETSDDIKNAILQFLSYLYDAKEHSLYWRQSHWNLNRI